LGSHGRIFGLNGDQLQRGKVKSSERLANVSDWFSLWSSVTSVVSRGLGDSPQRSLRTTEETQLRQVKIPTPVAQDATRMGTRTTSRSISGRESSGCGDCREYGPYPPAGRGAGPGRGDLRLLHGDANARGPGAKEAVP